MKRRSMGSLAIDAMPTLQDTHESAQVRASPCRKFVDVDYRCDECGAEVLRAVPRRTLGWRPK